MSTSLRNPLLLTLALSVLAPCSPAFGRDEEEVKPIFSLGKKPFVVLNVASLNRLKEDVEFVFATGEYPDAVDAIMDGLEDNINGLEGLNWDRSGGVMVFLDSVFPPAFEFVAYMPISSVEEYEAMLQSRRVIMREESAEEGRYELISQRGNVQLRIQGEYAFLQLPAMNPDPAFERELPDPAAFSPALANQYDVALSLDVEAVPKPTRDLIFNMLSSMMATQHQQKDDEPDSAYALRDAWQQRDIAGLKLFFQDTQRITIGVRVDEVEQGGDLDIVIDAREASDLLEEIFQASTKPSYFTPLITDETPVSLSYSAVWADRDRAALADTAEALKTQLAAIIEENDLGSIPDESSPLMHGLSALQDTAYGGHLDFFAQMYQDSDDKLAVVGAVCLEDGQAVAAGLQDLLIRLQDSDKLGDVEIAANEHADIAFHRIEFKNPDAGALELFGSGPGIMFGCGMRTCWVVVGGEESFDALKNVMDELEAAYENPVERDVPAAMRLVVNVTQLKDLIQGAEAAKRAARTQENDEEELLLTEKPVKTTKAADDKPGKGDGDGFRPQAPPNRGQRRREFFSRGVETLVETLAEGEDRIQIDFRPTDKGMRLRAHFSMGYVRAIGRIVGGAVTGD